MLKEVRQRASTVGGVGRGESAAMRPRRRMGRTGPAVGEESGMDGEEGPRPAVSLHAEERRSATGGATRCRRRFGAAVQHRRRRGSLLGL